MRKVKRFAIGTIAAAIIVGGAAAGIGLPQEAEASYWGCQNGHKTLFMVHDGDYVGYIEMLSRPC